jgi:uncharacterized protein
MRVVLDTNIVVSGLLWHGPPRQVLDAARAAAVTPFTTATLLAELQDVLGRPKFADRLVQAGVTAEELVLGYAALATVVSPAPIEPVVVDDPDDDAVLACAVAAAAKAIVSGDSHLFGLGQYAGIPIWTAAQLLEALREQGRS